MILAILRSSDHSTRRTVVYDKTFSGLGYGRGDLKISLKLIYMRVKVSLIAKFCRPDDRVEP